LKNYYHILGVSSSATAKEIKTAYRTLAKRYHPDVSSDPNAEERFIEVTQAYDILSHESKRKQYDRNLNYRKEKKQTTQTNQYEDWMRKQQQASRNKAKSHAKMGYKQYKQEYLYDSVLGFVGPKILGCFGAGILLLFLMYVAISVFESIALTIILFFAFGPALAWASTNIDYFHDKATLRKKMKKKKYRKR
jgi:curved DNA-binding protein CbpA